MSCRKMVLNNVLANRNYTGKHEMKMYFVNLKTVMPKPKDNFDVKTTAFG